MDKRFLQSVSLNRQQFAAIRAQHLEMRQADPRRRAFYRFRLQLLIEFLEYRWQRRLFQFDFHLMFFES